MSNQAVRMRTGFTSTLLASILLVVSGCAGSHSNPEAGGLSCLPKSPPYQSPLALTDASPYETRLGFGYRPSTLKLIKLEDTLQGMDVNGRLTVDGMEYTLLQFHFHTPSEHTFGGPELPMEAHLVHKNKWGQLAVVGVLFRAGDENDALKRILDIAPRSLCGEARLAEFSPESLLPPIGQREFYRYAGSLTTPPYTEGVTWLVMRRAQPISTAQTAAFRELMGSHSRKPQDRNGRTITISEGSAENAN